MQKLMVLSSLGIVVGLAGTVVTAQQGDAPSAYSAQGGQRSYEVAGFETISAIGPNDVVVSVGPAVSVRAEGDPDALDKYEVVVEDGELKIQPKRDSGWGFGWDDVKPAKFYVTMPQISAATLIGSGDMKVDRVDGGRFSATVTGSGQLDIAALSVDDAKLTIAGSGDLTARGRARTSEISIAGSGDVLARELTSDTAAVSIAGSGDAALTVQGNANVSIVGSGDVDIAGDARCTVTRMGSGEVRCNEG